MLRICVAGVGAVGGTVAAHLAAAGAEVTLLARGARLAQLQRDGLVVEFGGERLDVRLEVSDRAEFGAQDAVFLATKAHGLETLLPTLRPLIGPRTVVVPLVNGIPWWYFQSAGSYYDGDVVAAVDRHGALRDCLAPAQLIGSVVYLNARLLPSGRVSALAGQRRLILGALDAAGGPRCAELAALLTRGGLPSHSSPRIRDELWTKVALNLATNPLSVLTRATLHDLFHDPRWQPLVGAVLEEALRIAAAHGARPSLCAREMLALGRETGPFETSMLQDYRAGRPLELEAIGGSVLELAGKIGEHMPVTQLIVELCAARAARRGLETARGDPDVRDA